MRQLIALSLLLLPVPAFSHSALPTAVMPLGWKYPIECCAQRDCAVVEARYVKERPDGFHVDLPVGSHPMLTKRGYSGVVPYTAARNSPDNEYHICLSQEGAHRFCFFAGSRGS